MTDSGPDVSTTARRPRVVRWAVLTDALLLAALVCASLLDRRDLVSVLGPVHGGNFLLLVALVYTGAADRLWGWWFLAATVFTGGPPGAFVGERVIARRLERHTKARGVRA